MLSPKDKKDFLKSFDLVLCDCDGVIWHNLSDAIPGSDKTIQFLRSHGKHIVFVTNNSIASTEEQIKKFTKSNIEVAEEDLFHPSKTICDYLKSINFQGLILCFGSSAFKATLRQHGFKIVEEKDQIIDESISDLYRAVFRLETLDAIIFDVDFNFAAWKLMRAQVHLKNSNCLFIAGAADPWIPFGGRELIGPGIFLQALEKALGRKAKVLGKPGRDLGYLLQKKYNITDPRRVLVIGDSLTTDIYFGKMFGFQTLLVLTGATKKQDLIGSNLPDGEKPDFVIDKLEDLSKLYEI